MYTQFMEDWEEKDCNFSLLYKLIYSHELYDVTTYYILMK